MLLFPLMCKFPFNINLPLEIIRQIYIILIRENSIGIILKHCNLITKKTYALQNIISDMIYYKNLQPGKITRNKFYFYIDFLDNLNIILNSEFSRERYTYYFWQHLLHLISNRLMKIHNSFCIDCNDKRKNSEYCRFLQIINIWFKLLKKHNIRFRVSKYQNLKKNHIITTIVNSRTVLPIKNFNKFLYAPIVVMNNDDEIDTDDSINILKNYLI